MAKKLRRAVKAWVNRDRRGRVFCAWLERAAGDNEPCYIVPAAEYERLTRTAAKRGTRGK